MKKELEKRLINLSININTICKALDKSYLSYHLTIQVIRSSTSAALNYGEVQGAISRKDFIHKNSIVLKELKETKISLRLIEQHAIDDQRKAVLEALNECDQLVAIFYRTVRSSQINNR
ncbi:MAG: four helix bundle protein [Bacteroidales bacterium]|nr:four helix bundle protein [Bacteroidales bacterium]